MFRLFLKYYFILFACVLLYGIFGIVGEYTWMKDRVQTNMVNDQTGTVYLLKKLHAELGDDKLENALTEYPAMSHIPIAFSTTHEFNLSSEEEAKLKNNERVIYDAPENVGLYYKFPNSELVARVGPIGGDDQLDNYYIFYALSIFWFIALPLFFIILNLQSKLKRLEHAAVDFGQGNFSSRVPEQKKYKIGKLNHSFNQMAKRVEHLIRGHKELSNAVAHELRTPISRIRFELDMMQLEKDEKARNEYMYGISENIDELADLVDELLTYARFDREGTGVELKPYLLDDSLIKVINARHFGSDKQCHYDQSWIKGEVAKIEVCFAPKHLERAIGNLVTNAEKYSKSKIQIQVLQSPGSTSIIVDDDGQGIPVNERLDIFAPFKRLDTSRTRTTGGFGLGLAIV
jgi:signal transduction histidine kinase